MIRAWFIPPIIVPLVLLLCVIVVALVRANT
jgi:hypothetical protein